jgi:Restriction endonuclease
MSEYRDYENGVADVFAFLAGDSATVERNARLPGRRSGRQRQIDVLVRGRIFGMADATLIVDCKRRHNPIDVKAVEAFIGMMEDVGAEVGMVMTTAGSTGTARQRARAERGVHLEVMTLQDLMAWSPPGTVTTTYRFPVEWQADVEKALRNAGFRVTPNTGFETSAGEVILNVIRYYGTRSPRGEVQQRHMAESDAALRTIGVDHVQVAHSITMGGGTPGHRWLTVAVNGVPTDLKVLASTEEEAERELDRVAVFVAEQGIPRQALSVTRPDGWPVPPLFGL